MNPEPKIILERTAVCNILDGKGKIVQDSKGPVRFHIVVPVENAEQILKKKAMRFVEWWD